METVGHKGNLLLLSNTSAPQRLRGEILPQMNADGNGCAQMNPIGMSFRTPASPGQAPRGLRLNERSKESALSGKCGTGCRFLGRGI